MPNHPIRLCHRKIAQAEQIVENFYIATLPEDKRLLYTTLQDIQILAENIHFREADKLKKKIFSFNMKGVYVLLKFGDVFIAAGFDHYKSHFRGFLGNLKVLLHNESQTVRI